MENVPAATYHLKILVNSLISQPIKDSAKREEEETMPRVPTWQVGNQDKVLSISDEMLYKTRAICWKLENLIILGKPKILFWELLYKYRIKSRERLS